MYSAHCLGTKSCGCQKNSKLRVCLHPSELNHAIIGGHFLVQTLDDVIRRMPNAKVLSVLATFNAPFGHYSYTRFPFGIASAPDVFQNVMVHLFQGIESVEVIVDELVVWGKIRSREA